MTQAHRSQAWHLALRTGALLALTAATACGTKDNRDTGEGPAGAGRESCSWGATPLTFWQGEGAVDLTRFELANEISDALSLSLPAGLHAALVDAHASRGAQHFDFRYMAANVPFCGPAAHAHRIGDRTLYEGMLATSGLDAASWQAAGELTFPAAAGVLSKAAAELGVTDAAAQTLVSAERCWLVEDGKPQPAYELAARIAGQPYRIVGSPQRLASVETSGFDITGEARVFERNAQHGAMITVPLTDLGEGTRLRSSRFTSAVGGTFELAENPDRRYVYEADDPHFVEVSVFTNAERMATWFSKPEHGYSMGCVPIEVEAHAEFLNPYTGSRNVNNGAYVPPGDTGTGYPQIRMGDGDGLSLRDLGTDFDTVAHELGHHVFYRRVKSADGESGVLHEGVSDYFVFAATGDACLAESVCMPGSMACYVDSQCMRTAANDLTYDSPELPLDRHWRSQLISGMLWDVGSKFGLGQDRVATNVMKAIDYLSSKPDFTEFVKALMAADLELSGGVDACTYLEAAKDRGLGERLADVSCDDYKAVP